MAPSRKLPSGATTEANKAWEYHSPGHDVAEAIIPCTGQLPPEFADWPTHMQDELFLAAEQLALMTGKPYTLYHAICDYDIDAKGWYVRAIAIAPRGAPTLRIIETPTQH
jgi:hypothetical protein